MIILNMENSQAKIFTYRKHFLHGSIKTLAYRIIVFLLIHRMSNDFFLVQVYVVVFKPRINSAYFKTELKARYLKAIVGGLI